jgi:hypothetical protein
MSSATVGNQSAEVMSLWKSSVLTALQPRVPRLCPKIGAFQAPSRYASHHASSRQKARAIRKRTRIR